MTLLLGYGIGILAKEVDMSKQLQCDCGFIAGGPDTTIEELQEVAVVHVKMVHADMLPQMGGEQGVRAATPSMLKEV